MLLQINRFTNLLFQSILEVPFSDHRCIDPHFAIPRQQKDCFGSLQWRHLHLKTNKYL